MKKAIEYEIFEDITEDLKRLTANFNKLHDRLDLEHDDDSFALVGDLNDIENRLAKIFERYMVDE